MHVLQRHAEFGVDLIHEVFEHRMREARLIGLRRYVALIVRPLVHREEVNVFAVYLEVVDKLREGDIGLGLGVA